MSVSIECSSRRQKCDQERSPNLLIYNDFTIEAQRMWNVKVEMTPVIIVVTGTISQSFRYYLSNIPGKQKFKALQKTAILVTAHTLREVLK
jgi:uncharacterized membrane protein YjdF